MIHTLSVIQDGSLCLLLWIGETETTKMMEVPPSRQFLISSYFLIQIVLVLQ